MIYSALFLIKIVKFLKEIVHIGSFFLLAEPWAWNKEDFRPSIPINEGPIFDNSLVTNVTAQLGGTAHLQCKVLNIRDKDNPVRDFYIFS